MHCVLYEGLDAPVFTGFDQGSILTSAIMNQPSVLQCALVVASLMGEFWVINYTLVCIYTYFDELGVAIPTREYISAVFVTGS